jgi:hypothetical protein
MARHAVRFSAFCVLASTILTLTACEQARNLNEMHDTTAEMRDITRDMRDQMKDMNQTTGKMGKSTNSMNDSMQAMLDQMHEMNTLMKSLIQNTADMNTTTQTMNGSLLDMKQAMDVMKANTEALASKMDHLSKVTESNLGETNTRMKTMTVHMDSMDRTTDSLCQGNRHGQTELIRTDGFKKMLEAKTPDEKVARASQYMLAFEFQTWGLCGDKLETRDQLIKTAMEEFFFDIKETLSSREQAASMASAHLMDTQDNDRDNNFNALAAALHRIDMDQQPRLIEQWNAKNKQKVSQESLASLILNAYLTNKQGKPLNEWQKVVIANTRVATRLLQARHNFMASAVVGKLVKEATSGVATKMSLLISKIFRGGTTWTADLSGHQTQELNQLSEYLTFSLETRANLTKIGIKPVTDAELAPFLKGVKLTHDNRGNAETLKARQRFIALMTKLKAQAAL